MTLRFATLVCLLVGASCVPSPRRSAHTYPGAHNRYGQGGSSSNTAGAAPSTELDSDPSKALRQVDQHLRSNGYTPSGPAVRNRNMPENGVVAYALDARDGKCYAIFALAHSSADLNMVVLDPNGRTVGYNVNPDPHPWATLCPPSGGRYIVRLQMAEGSGEYYYAAYKGPPNRNPHLAQLFEPRGPSAGQVERAQLDESTTERLEEIDDRLGADDFQRDGEPRGLVLSEQGPRERSFPVNLEKGQCYAFATVAGPGAKDTDVFVIDGAGKILAKDEGETRNGVVRYCAPTSGKYYVRSLMYEGDGPVFVAAYHKDRSPSESTPEPAKESGDGDERLMSEDSVEGTGLEENFRLLKADMQARGYQSHGEPSRGTLQQGQTQDFAIHLEGGKCYAILAVGDDGVRDLDLILLDARGNKLDRDMENDSRPIVRVCPGESNEFTMRVRMSRGSGKFVYAPYRWPRGTRGPFGLRGLMYVRVAEVTSLLNVEGYQPDPSYTPNKGTLSAEGKTQTHTVELKGDRCYSILVVGGKGVANLDLSLSKGGRELATDGSRNAFPSVRHCTLDPGQFKLQVEAANGSGKYFMQVFRRGEPEH
jgi:hypothetical protein